MEIRKKITNQFIIIVAFIQLFASIVIYFSFSQTRKEDFYNRLESKAKLAGQMLLDIDEIDRDLLAKIERNNPQSLPNERIIIFDYKNQVIFSNDDGNLIKIPVKLINTVRLDGDIRLVKNPFEVYGKFYTNDTDRIVVFVAAQDIFGFNKLKGLQIILFTVYILFLVIVFFAGRYFSRNALNPVSAMIRKVDNIEISNLNERLDEENGQDELASLAQTFNRMLQRLEVSFLTHKSFISNASHELRTPLTVLTGQIDVLLLKDRSTDEYKNALRSMLDDIKNLNQISDKLLLLTQVSSGFPETDFIDLRIDDVIWQSRNELMKRKNNYTIRINFVEPIDDDEKLILKGNELLLKTAFLNIMDNACKYSEDKTVNVYLSTSDDFVKLLYKDQGTGIDNEDLGLVFQPFFRGKNAKSTKGHGIGLSLVEKIIQLHNGKITIMSTLCQGTEVVCLLPYK